MFLMLKLISNLFIKHVFYINIVANNIFVNKKFYFDTIHNYFYKNAIFVIFVSRINVHYVFENNKIFEKMKNFAIIVRKNFTLK